MVEDHPDYSNPLDVASWRHDRGYGRIQEEGRNPYIRFNRYDQEYLDDPAVQGIPRAVFQIKRYLAPMEEKYPLPDNMSRKRDLKYYMENGPLRARRKFRRANRTWAVLPKRTWLKASKMKFPKKSIKRRRYRKRKFSRRSRKGGNMRLALRNFMSAIAPIRKILGEAYTAPFADDNNYTYHYCRELGSAQDGTCYQLVHGSASRHKEVMEAAWGSTSLANYINSAENFWLSSRTENRVYNSGNNMLYVTVSEVVRRRQGVSASGPLYALNNAYNSTEGAPASIAGAFDKTAHNYDETKISTGTYFAKLNTPNHQTYRTWPMEYHQQFKRIRVKKFALKPGQSAKIVQTSKYGRIRGQSFDLWTHDKARFLIFSIRGQLAIDNTGATFGTFSGGVAILTLTKDIVRKLPDRKYPDTVLLRPLSASAFVTPNLTNGAERISSEYTPQAGADE